MAQSISQQARQCFDSAVSARTARVYLIESPLSETDIACVTRELLTDPVTQQAVIAGISTVSGLSPGGPSATIEVHYKPGVMDPVAQSTREAILEMFPMLNAASVEARTGYRYDLSWTTGAGVSQDTVHRFAQTTLANPVIQDIYDRPYHPQQFEHGSPYDLRLIHVPIRDLDDQALITLSRDGHLFLNLEEMRAIQAFYRSQSGDREPTDIELETLAQTWSEHCVHKTLKATIHYHQPQAEAVSPSAPDWSNRPGHTLHEDGSITIDNLLKNTIAAATQELMRDQRIGQWCISVFEDNAGIVGFDDDHAVCIKVETHNHPSAIEPYGGAATGIGGCIRDIMGTGLAAKPIANMDVFCVASPEFPLDDLPKGVIPPRRTLQQVVAGVRDYGNRMGIPTVNGAVWFHDDYVANPLVFAGCVGLMPRDKCFGQPLPGDRIIVLGGRTGRDGIHGATFSSDELTDSHADEFSHAVQIGNPITQKKTLDVILQARDHAEGCLFHAITDCGAGGLSSAVGEMGQQLGAFVTLEAAPLKYRGLSYTEIWISEAQERMVLAVAPGYVDPLKQLCDAEEVEMCNLGYFGEQDDQRQPQLVLTYKEIQVGRLSMDFLHNGLPSLTRTATYPPQATEHQTTRDAATAPPHEDLPKILHQLLSHPNIASKHWIIRQYDHEVQGGSVIKPLVGPGQDGPGDAAVLRPKLASIRGVAIGCGLQTGLGEKAIGGRGDAYWMTLGSIDEAVRNVVCVGADPKQVAILDNFSWPRCDDPAQLGSLVRAAEACYDGAIAYRTPFVSGKDSLSNQFTTEAGELITIPPTLLITALGIVPDVSRCRTMDAKSAGNPLLIVGLTDGALGGSHYLMITQDPSRDPQIPQVNLKRGPATALAVSSLIANGLVESAHDCSDGGLLVAAAEIAFAGRVGLDLDLTDLATDHGLDAPAACFAETPSRYLLEVTPANLAATVDVLRQADIPCGQIGTFTDHDRLTVRIASQGQILDEPLDQLRRSWMGPLNW